MAETLYLNQTSQACPSQWEGQLVTGQYFYARYRFGQITIGLGHDLQTAHETVSYQDQIGDPLDGMILQSQMLQYLDLALLVNHTPAS